MIFVKAIISIIILMACGLNLSQIGIKKKDFLIWLIVISVVTSLITIVSEIIAGVASLILLVVMLYVISKKVVSSLIYMVMSMIIAVIGDNVIAGILKMVASNGEVIRQKLDINIGLYILFSLCVFVFVFSLSKVLGVIINKKKIIDQILLNKKIGLILSVFILLTFVFIYTSALLEADTNPFLNVGIYIVYFVFIMIITNTLLFITKKEVEYKNKKKELEQLSQYTKNLEILYSDIRKVRHDYMNVLSSMMGYMDSKDMEGLTNYFNNKIIPFSNKLQSNDSKLGLLSYIKMPEAKGLIAFKTIYSQERGIKVILDITEEIIIDKIDIVDLCRILGILLDNAIEAALESDNPIMKIALIKNTNSTIIVITNSIGTKTPPIHKMFEKNFSTKGEKRGLGLSNLREIINAYPKINMDTIIKENEFRQIIEIINI